MARLRGNRTSAATLTAALTATAVMTAPIGLSLRPAGNGTPRRTTGATALPPPADPLAVPAHAGTGGTAPTEDACTDPAASWLGTRWRTPLRWRFNAATTPAYLTDPAAVRDTIASAAHNVTAAVNPCGLTGSLTMAERYDGETTRAAAVKPDGNCGAADGANQVSFGDLAPGLLAVTCVWWRNGDHRRDGSTLEADILISARPGLFYLGQQPADCGSRWDLEGAITHEFGHAFGLGHVAAAEHPDLTMGDALSPCDDGHRGLGLGDYTMLRDHYR